MVSLTYFVRSDHYDVMPWRVVMKKGPKRQKSKAKPVNIFSKSEIEEMQQEIDLIKFLEEKLGDPVMQLEVTQAHIYQVLRLLVKQGHIQKLNELLENFAVKNIEYTGYCSALDVAAQKGDEASFMALWHFFYPRQEIKPPSSLIDYAAEGLNANIINVVMKHQNELDQKNDKKQFDKVVEAGNLAEIEKYLREKPHLKKHFEHQHPEKALALYQHHLEEMKQEDEKAENTNLPERTPNGRKLFSTLTFQRLKQRAKPHAVNVFDVGKVDEPEVAPSVEKSQEVEDTTHSESDDQSFEKVGAYL